MRAAILAVFLLLAIPGQSQFTNQQKQAFADMQLSCYLDPAYGIDTHVVRCIARWYTAGNVNAARIMILEVYNQATGITVGTQAQRHALKHWIERYNDNLGTEMSEWSGTSSPGE
jgi:hypothetical protein